MRRMIKFVTITATLAVFAAPALAQSKECNDENKASWYGTFLSNFRGERPQQKIAYDAARLYLTSCPEDPADAQAAYMKNKFVIPYEKMIAAEEVAKQFDAAVKDAKYVEQIRLGKLVLANSPDNTAVYIIMGMAGVSEPSVLGESAQFAKKAIELIQGGKPAMPYTRDQALAYLNWSVAKGELKNSPADAITYLLKAARIDSDPKKNHLLYLDLAAAYEEGPRAKLAAEYTSKVGPNQTETPESKLAFANLSQVIDRQIDAWARAEALATDAVTKKAIMDDLTALYKYRNKSETGLDVLLAGILSKPLPDVPTPITSLPTPTPVSTPATNGTPTGTNGGTSNNTAANGQTKASSIGTAGATGAQNANKTTSGAKPGATPAPANKPKPRRADHRRG